MVLTAGEHLGPWAIVAPLGAGGTGEVYLAKDSRTGTSVALKLLHTSSPEAERRFQDEARLAATLDHPNICPLIDVGVWGNRGYLVMPLLDGQTLAERLSHGPLPIPAVLELGRHLALALAHAHERGILHRDVKPSNVMLTSYGAVLFDFGLALPDASSNKTSALAFDDRTALGDDPDTLPEGTLFYMAPEQLRGGKVDARSDLFSLGAVLYECLTGQKAFKADSAAECVRRTLHDTPVPVAGIRPETPGALQALVAACLEKELQRRPKTAADVAMALDRVEYRAGWRVAALAASILLVAVQPASTLALETIERLVVLPCGAPSQAAGDLALARGLTEVVTVKLSVAARPRELEVVSRSSVREHRLSEPAEAQRLLRATLALECSLIAGSELPRVTCELLDLVKHRSLSAFAVTAEPNDPLALHDHVVQWAIASLKLSRPTAPDTVDDGLANVAYLRALGYLNDGSANGRRAAVEALDEALQRAPDFVAAQAAMAKAQLALHRRHPQASTLASAQSACDRVVALAPSSAGADFCQAEILRETGRYAAALARYRRVLDRDPADQAAYLGKAQAEEGLGQFADAESTYQMLVVARPNSVEGYGWLSEFYRRRGNAAQAERVWSEIVRRLPSSPLVYRRVGLLHQVAGRYDQAVAAYRQSLALAEDTETYYNLGQTYAYQLRFPDAIRMLELAANDEPDCRKVGGLARAYYWNGDREIAMTLYGRARSHCESELRVDPGNADLHLLAADYAAKMGEADAARSQLMLAHAVDDDPLAPADGHTLAFVAGVLNSIGDRERAAAWLSRSVQAGVPDHQLDALVELRTLRASMDAPKSATGVRQQ
ncbi:MAG: protein kinase [Vicinamibacterales bacterium]